MNPIALINQICGDTRHMNSMTEFPKKQIKPKTEYYPFISVFMAPIETCPFVQNVMGFEQL